MASARRKVVIFGAGYGGLRTALKLEQLLRRDPNWQILLIDRYNYHQLKTEIHEVAAGRITPKAATIPIATLIRGRKIEFTQAEIVGIDFDQRMLSSSHGEIRYDILVMASGSETQFFGIPGLQQSSFSLSSVEDALHIREHIHDMFAQARTETDEAKKKALLTVVIGGGGFTGVELATELRDYLRKLSKKFGMGQDEAHLIVIEARDSILPGFDLDLISYAQQVMTNKGITLKLKTPCVSAEPSRARLKTGEEILTYTIIWTGGIQACEIVADSGLKQGASGRIIVNSYLESIDHPEVYVVGDSALVLDLVTHRPLAPTAQLALQQAEIAAVNIYADVKGLKRMRYVPKIAGQFVSLGGRNAVGWVWRFKVTGLTAWFLKRMTLVRYYYSIGGLRLMVQRLLTVFA